MSKFSFVPDDYELAEGRELTPEEERKLQVPEVVQQSEFKEDAPFIKDHLKGQGLEGAEQAFVLSRGDIDWTLQEFVGLSPEDIKIFKQIRDKENIPFTELKENKDAWKKYKKVEDIYNSILRRDAKGQLETPVLARHLADPEKLIMHKDSLEALKNLEQAIITYNRPQYQKLWHTLKEGTKSLGYNLISTLKSMRVENLQNDQMEYESIKKAYPDNPMLQALYKTKVDDSKQIIKALDDAKDSEYLSPNPLAPMGNIEQLVHDFVGVFPQFVGAVGSTMLTKNPKAGMAFMYPQIHGQTYDQLTREGVKHDKALAASWRNGLIQSWMETIPLGKWMKVFKAPVGRQPIKKLVQQFLVVGITESGTEFLQSFPDEYTKEFARARSEGLGIGDSAMRALEKTPEAFKQGLYEGLVMAPMAFLGMGGSVVRQYAYNKQAKKDSEFFEQEVNAIKESDLMKKDYQEYQEFMEEVHEHYGVSEDLYIPAKEIETLYQDNPQELQNVLNELGADEQTYRDSSLTGEYKVNRSKFIHKFANTEAFETLKNKLRFSPDSITEFEAEQIRENFEQELKEVQKDFAERVKENSLPKQAQDIRAKLIQDFKMSADDADANIMLMVAGARIRAKETGEDIDQWFSRVNPVLQVGKDYVVSDKDALFQKQHLGFYSNIEKQLEKLNFNQMPVKKLKEFLANMKAEELEYSGIMDWLDTHEGKISRGEVVKFLQEGGVKLDENILSTSQARYISTQELKEYPYKNWHTLNTQDVYGEVFYVHTTETDLGDAYILETETFDENYDPEIEGDGAESHVIYYALVADQLIEPSGQQGYNSLQEAVDAINDHISEEFENEDAKYERWSSGKGTNYREVLLTIPNSKEGDFESPHFSNYENLVVHFRLTDYLHDGKKTLFVEEIQSDWHQEGRKKGYQDPKKRKAVTQEYDKATEEYRSLSDEISGKKEYKFDKIYGFEDFGEPEVTGFGSEIRRLDVTEALKFELHIKDGDGVYLYKKRLDTGELSLIDDWRLSDLERQIYDADRYIKEQMNPGNEHSVLLPPFFGVHSLKTELLKEDFEKLASAESKYLKLREQIKEADTGVPDAPFKTTKAWSTLALKRILRMAADKNYDEVAWTTGATQSQRYNLQQFLSGITYKRNEDGTFYIRPEDRNGQEINHLIRQGVTLEELRELIGVNAAERMDKGEGGMRKDGFSFLDAADVDVGGSEMKEYYDKILPNTVNNYVKKLDKSAKAKRGPLVYGHKKSLVYEGKSLTLDEVVNRGIELEEEHSTLADDIINNTSPQSEERNLKRLKLSTLARKKNALRYVEQRMRDNGSSFKDAIESMAPLQPSNVKLALETLGQDENAVKEKETGESFDSWKIPLTKKMKGKVLKGQSLFQGKEAIKGSVQFKDNQTIVNLYKNADYSTFLHETFHIFNKEMQRNIDLGLATEETVQDYKELVDYAGGKLDRKGYEKLAVSFETYLREGKAPSVTLARAFRKFKDWLMSIYKTLRGLDANINDNIRGIFDRMLASEEEIKEVETYYSAKQSLQDIIPMPERQKAVLNKKKEEARQSSNESQIKKTITAYRKAIGGREGFKERATKEVEKQKVYKDIADIVDQGGIDYDELKTLRGQKFVTALRKKHKGVLAKRGYQGVPVAAATMSLGYKTEEQLIAALESAPSKTTAIKNATDELIEQTENNIKEAMTNNESFMAEESYHTPQRLDYLVAQAQMLADKISRKEKRERERLEAKIFKDAAAERIGELPVWKATRFTDYSRAEIRYAKEMKKFLEKGKLVEAQSSLKKLIMNNAMVLASIDARLRIQKKLKSYKTSNLKKRFIEKNTGRGKVELVHKNAALELLNHYDINNDLVSGQKNALQQLRKDVPFIEQAISDYVFNKQLPKHFRGFRDLSFNQFSEVTSAIDTIIKNGSNILSSIRDERYQSIDEFTKDSIERMNALPDYTQYDDSKTLDKLFLKIDSFNSDFQMMQFIFNRADNYTLDIDLEMGPMRSLYKEGVAREVVYHDMKKKAVDAAIPHWRTLMDAIIRIQKKHFDGAKRFNIEGVPVHPALAEKGKVTWSVENMITLFLNMGNDSNADVLMRAYNYSPEQVSKIMSYFTKEEMRAIQGIWDATNILFPELDKVFFSNFNRHLTKIEARPLYARDESGEVVKLKGGYYPLDLDMSIYDDKNLNKREAEKELDLINEELVFNNVSMPSTKAIKERVEGHSIPPRLDLKTWFTHVNEVSRYISHAEYMRDVRMIVSNPEWRKSFVSKFGRNTYERLLDWTSAISRNKRGNYTWSWESRYEKTFDHMRRAATIAILGANIPVGFKQRISVKPAIKAIGLEWVLEGYKQAGLNSQLGLSTNEMIQKVYAQSDYLRVRDATNIDREIQEAIRGLDLDSFKIKYDGKYYTKKDLQDMLFYWIQMNDRATVVPVWIGAFQKYLHKKAGTHYSYEEGSLNTQDEKLIRDATAYADSIVQDTQPSSLPIDLSALQRAEGTTRFFTSFMTWTLKAGNRFQAEYKKMRDGKISKGEYFAHIFYEVFLSSWGGYVITNLFSYDDEGDWKDKLTDMLLLAPLEISVSWMPIVNQAVRELVTGRPTKVVPAAEYGYRARKVFSHIRKLIKDDPDLELDKAALDVLSLLELYAGLPAQKLIKDMVKYEESFENITDDITR